MDRVVYRTQELAHVWFGDIDGRRQVVTPSQRHLSVTPQACQRDTPR